MKVFKAILKQNPACDYSIECGTKVINIDVPCSSLYEAEKLVRNIIKENYSTDNTKLVSAEVFEIKSISKLNLDLLYKVIQKEQIIEDPEYKEFLRLQEKFKLHI
jgi:hypothetical protein